MEIIQRIGKNQTKAAQIMNPWYAMERGVL